MEKLIKSKQIMNEANGLDENGEPIKRIKIQSKSFVEEQVEDNELKETIILSQRKLFRITKQKNLNKEKDSK